MLIKVLQVKDKRAEFLNSTDLRSFQKEVLSNSGTISVTFINLAIATMSQICSVDFKGMHALLEFSSINMQIETEISV